MEFIKGQMLMEHLKRNRAIISHLITLGLLHLISTMTKVYDKNLQSQIYFTIYWTKALKSTEKKLTKEQ